ncbi:hypothetical protein ACRRTK_014454 [Alexandromys fortis]
MRGFCLFERLRWRVIYRTEPTWRPADSFRDISTVTARKLLLDPRSRRQRCVLVWIWLCHP